LYDLSIIRFVYVGDFYDDDHDHNYNNYYDDDDEGSADDFEIRRYVDDFDRKSYSRKWEYERI
jgi:hypothetical protein